MTVSTEHKFAVVGVGGIFPDANDIEQFWKNILHKKVSIEPLPAESMERDVFFRPEVHALADKQDRSYTDLWATIKHIDFDAGTFRIPPNVASRMDTNQKLSLLVAQQALAYDGLKSVSKDRVAVIMGNSMIGQLHHDYIARFDCDKFEYYLRQQPLLVERLSPQEQAQVLSAVRSKIVGGFPSVTEDTAPGVLPNIIAARICSVFDLHGHAYTVDAACASGLAAIICGIQQLRLGEVDAVICGASDLHNGEAGRVYFSGIGALSPDGSFPFDERANGFVTGDGAGAVVIKRLDDALAARDRIFGLIVGYGQASDGKGKAIAAPNKIWQSRTIRRAWEMAGASPDSIELIEAHGTSTQVGDLSEVNALKLAFQELGATRRGYCGLGSVKSNIGHLKSAAGIAGFIKALLAIDRKTLPPTAGFRTENPQLKLAESPFYVLSDTREWNASELPRRAGVSAFGFGGADYHIALQEYREQDYAGRTTRAVSYPTPKVVTDEALLTAEWTAPLLFSADNANELLPQVQAFAAAAAQSSTRISELTLAQSLLASARAPARLAFSATCVDDLRKKLEVLRQWLGQPAAKSALWAKGIALETAAPIESDAVAVLFPGQGSQYPDMLRPLVERYAAARQVFARADALWRSLWHTGVSELIDSCVRGKDETDQLLRQTQNTHPALFVSSLASYRVLEEMGFVPKVMVGHSVGEFTALTASGKLTLGDGLKLLSARAHAFSAVPAARTGAMLALPCDAESASAYLRESGVHLAIANVNSRNQTIVSGDEDAVGQLVDYCNQRSIKCVRLNVSHAFHSPLMQPAETQFRCALDKVDFRAGRTTVIANGSNEYYPASSQDVRVQLQTQITGSVQFAKSIERLYADGIRLFVEVGPSSVLSQLVRDILSGQDVTVLSSDSKRGDSLEAFQRMLCGLFAAGIEIDPTAATLQKVESSANLPTVTIQTSATHARSQAVVDPGETLTIVPPVDASRKVIVYSGVSAGLPGSYKAAFRDDNFEQLFEGRNLIERLTDDERQRLVDLRVTKVVKSEQGASFATLSSLNEVIQLAGKLGQLDLGRDYFVGEKDMALMSTAIAHAVAAGYEALKDAQIPLVHEYTRTAGGSMLPERWALPKEMQRHTGVIFANGFPMVDPIIREVSRHLSYRFGSRVRGDLFEFYDTLLAKVTDRESRKLLSDWYALNYQRLAAVPSQGEVYSFNHQLMTQISMQANNRLARFINARGPNFQINAACSSTATAVTLAEELIRGGRAKRMIVIGADDPSSEQSLTYLGAGFLSTGACTDVGDLYEAALPFDKRRNGMIMGSGAVGIVVEEESECKRRGVVPLCDLLGSHCFNTAGHSSQLDVPRYAEELEMFVTRMENLHGIRRKEVSRQLVYVSHETYTPARGGCSEAEAVALRHVFGEDYREIEISNTKGMTGHTMGASIEDAVAAKALQFGQAPPVVNHRQTDPALEGLKLGQGAPADFQYALRMAAGFGSQGNYILLKRRARTHERIENPATHAQWLTDISGLERASLTVKGRVLVVKDDKPGSIVVDRPDVGTCRSSTRPSSHIPANPIPNLSAIEQTPQTVAGRAASDVPVSAGCVTGLATHSQAPSEQSLAEAKKLVLDVVAAITGYATNILDLDMELEADLGIDTVKQATVLATLAERMQLSELSGFRLSEYPTLRSIAELCEAQSRQGTVSSPPPSSTLLRPQAVPEATEQRHAAPATDNGSHRQSLAAQVLEVIASVTGYGQEILGEDMELEADLGIDTVKQATVLSLLGERLGLARDTAMKMSDLLTIRQLVDYLSAIVAGVPAERSDVPSRANALSNGSSHIEATAVDSVAPATAQAVRVNESSVTRGSGRPVAERTAHRTEMPAVTIIERLFAIIGELSPYPSEMLEPELTVQDDLELNEAVQSALHTAVVERFALPTDFRYPQNASVGQIAELVAHAQGNRDNASSALGQDRSLNQSLGRQVLALHPAPCSQVPVYDYRQKRIWVLGDDAQTVARLTERLGAMNCNVGSLVFAQSGRPTELFAPLEELFARGQPNVLIDMTATPTQGAIGDQEPSTVLRAIERAADSRFALCKWLTERKAIPERVLAVTAIDGRFGLLRDADTASASAIYGLHIGFYKAIRKEWTSCFLSILDLEPKGLSDEGAGVLQLIERELALKGIGVEVCYLSGTRHRVIAEDSSWESLGVPGGFDQNEVVVVSGGGAGVTAQLVLELGRQYPVKFALIGRTALDPSAQGLDVTNEATRATCKTAIQKRLTESGQRVTPNLIEQALARLERSADIYRTLCALEQYGCKACYYQADVCDLSALSAVVADIRQQLGPITTLIHGAGLEISHRIEQKSLEEFHRVYAVKAVGAYHLDWLCRKEPLRRVIAVSSISGRYGNPAQTDYCAGNAFLDLCMRTERRVGVRAVSLLWSGWGQLGMAWRNSYVREHAEQKGLNFIDPASGARAAVLEIAAATGPSEVVIHRGLADVTDAECSDCFLGDAPLIDWVEKREGTITSAHRRFSPRRDEFLNQHRFAGIPYMPGVGFMEMMVEVAALMGAPNDGVVVFENLSFSDGFKLHRDEPRDVRVDVIEKSTGQYQMNVRSPFKPKLGTEWELRDYASALVHIRPHTTEPIACPDWSLELTEQTHYGEIFENAKRRKQNVQLGPLFNDAHRSEAAAVASRVRWSRHGIETLVALPKTQIDHPGYPLNQFRINPAFLDALHQAGAVLSIQLTDQVYLPVGAEQFVVYEAPRNDEVYRVVAKLKTLDERQATYDMVMMRQDGSCCVRLTNSQFRRISA